jgi:hypothetical protein
MYSWCQGDALPSRATGQATDRGSFTLVRLNYADRRILKPPGEAHIPTPDSQSRHAQPLDLLHRTGSIAPDAERQPEVETTVSRDQDQDIARDSVEGRNTSE